MRRRPGEAVDGKPERQPEIEKEKKKCGFY
jgi:hypothetical protein